MVVTIMYLQCLRNSFVKATQISPASQAVRIKIEGTEVGLETVLRLTHIVVEDTVGRRERVRAHEHSCSINISFMHCLWHKIRRCCVCTHSCILYTRACLLWSFCLLDKNTFLDTKEEMGNASLHVHTSQTIIPVYANSWISNLYTFQHTHTHTHTHTHSLTQ